MIVAGDRDLIPAQSLIDAILGKNLTGAIYDADTVTAPAAAPSTAVLGYGLSDGEVRATQVDLRHDGTTLTISTPGGEISAHTSLLGDTAVYAVLALVAAAIVNGRDVAEVVAALAGNSGMGERRMASAIGLNGALVIDDSFGADRAATASALRSLAQFGHGGGRTIVVLGSLDAPDDSNLEDHQAIGLLLVRLNISLLIAVGADARQLYSAANLEGSWDGEAVIVETPREAYDLLCDYTRENDVVLVKGKRSELMHPIVELLVGGVA